MPRNVPWHWRLLAQNSLCLNKQTLSTLKSRRLYMNCQLGIIPATVQLLHHAWELLWTVLLGMDWNYDREHHNYLMAQSFSNAQKASQALFSLQVILCKKNIWYGKMKYSCTSDCFVWLLNWPLNKSDCDCHSALHFRETEKVKKEKIWCSAKKSIKKWLIPLKNTWFIALF